MAVVSSLDIGDMFVMPGIPIIDKEERVGVVVVKTSDMVGVSFVDWHSGHDLGGRVSDSSGWWLLPGMKVTPCKRVPCMAVPEILPDDVFSEVF